MATEIERKFLVKGKPWEREDIKTLSRYDITQGYLAKGEATVRIRTMTNGRNRVAFTSKDLTRYELHPCADLAYITIKGPRRFNACKEYEYPIPFKDAAEMLTMCGNNILSKTRHTIRDYNNRVWEIDVFRGLNEGLIVAEIELDSPYTNVILPDWIDKEVSDDPQYTNSYLVTNKVFR